ncbi:MAG TPA: zinc-dependent metalloprotease [Thermoanaerobaculia bacterium]|nr:zinc-dependent metalloprotease [Thermoanaerobaculia bacterium]
MSRLVLPPMLLVLVGGCATSSRVARADAPQRPGAITAKVQGMTHMDGLIPLHFNEADGKLYLEVSRPGQEFLYQTSLASGVGINWYPVGLDRNQIGRTAVVRFERMGPKVLLIQRNYGFRALSDDPMERAAVEDSFAQSVLGSFDVVAVEGTRVLIDATSFFLRDAHGVQRSLETAGEGTFTLEASRSAFWLPRTKSFPKNTEIEALLTFTSPKPGARVEQIAPDANTVSVRQHHSLVELPPPGYTPREHDPRTGFLFIDFHDYASSIDEPIRKRWIMRHRLQKKNPSAAVSDPVEPIVYYLDPGTPEPIRSALFDGARWWNDAFEAAGFRNAFRVEMLPPDADPLDVRYNMITWVHRSTRGWSYGASVVDPRTGEIIKGNVSLGSLRVRQDLLLAEGLNPLFDESHSVAAGEYLAGLDSSTNPVEMSLARLRQLAAHEVGHTLGLSHNFAASTYGRASVMDYPAPLVRIVGDRLDLSDAYGRGVGAFDKFAIAWGYSQFAPGVDERGSLKRIVEDGIAAGMLYLTDEDARPAGAANPLANLWDNGPDPVAMLQHEMEVRRIGMSRIGLGSIAEGAPVSTLEATFLPLYLHHRYQVDAAVKTLGGVEYTYSVKTDGTALPRPVTAPVAALRQHEALKVLLTTLAPSFLAIPRRILELLPPAADGVSAPTLETFERRTGSTFDAIGVATIAADGTLLGLLQHERAARMIEQKALDAAQPGFDAMVRALVDYVWTRRSPNEYEQSIRRAVQSLLVRRLMDTAAETRASSQVRAIAEQALRSLGETLAGAGGSDSMDMAHRRTTAGDIRRFLSRPAGPWQPLQPLQIPAGSPI